MMFVERFYDGFRLPHTPPSIVLRVGESTSKPLSGFWCIDDNIIKDLIRFVKYG
jgi:hypothetical protein